MLSTPNVCTEQPLNNETAFCSQHFELAVQCAYPTDLRGFLKFCGATAAAGNVTPGTIYQESTEESLISPENYVNILSTLLQYQPVQHSLVLPRVNETSAGTHGIIFSTCLQNDMIGIICNYNCL